jgi:hypothetical protein
VNGPPLRSLKPWCVDLIRYGARSSAMRREGRDKAVYNAIYRTALSAVNAGWIFAEWHAQISARSSVLGAQVATKRNGQDRPREQVEKQLRTIWAKAENTYAASPSFEPEDRAAHITAVRSWLADPGCPLPDNQRIVLDAIARRAAELNCTSPNCPRDSYLRPATGLGLTALRTALDQLVASGLLVQTQKGRRGTRAGTGSGVAGVYRLPRPADLPPLRRDQALTSAAIAASSAPGVVPLRVSSAPHPDGNPQVDTAVPHPAPAPEQEDEDPMITVIVKGAHAEELTARLAELLAGTGAQMTPAPKPRHLAAVLNATARTADARKGSGR